MTALPGVTRCALLRHQKDPPRALTVEEWQTLGQLSRASSAPTSHVALAKLVLAVADGRCNIAAARRLGARTRPIRRCPPQAIQWR